ncbi:MAG TPA: molybdenum cofactor guanylyltransferase [Fimbriimonadaceae bacterium]|nr:molybdenum cofactor guanylyltransferase [Fimbriimonadaceae bacterium]HRJ96770.1 molybdenum cofactor guanylyltransferase [Fimbriimonadaceae bacterium]
MNLLALVLTGGSSRRMGANKADLVVGGVALGLRLCRTLDRAGFTVLVLGREVEGYRVSSDQEPGAGPLAALAGVRLPDGIDAVFVAACDAVLLEGLDARRLVDHLLANQGFDAVVPALDGRPQPLCAAYQPNALIAASGLSMKGETRVMAWLEAMRVQYLGEDDLVKLGLHPEHFRSANTPEEFDRLRRVLLEVVVDSPVGRAYELDELEGHAPTDGTGSDHER